VDVRGSAAAVLGLLETATRIVGRFRKASERQKDLAGVLGRHALKLVNVKSMINIVEDNDGLQTTTVSSACKYPSQRLRSVSLGKADSKYHEDKER